MKKISALLLMIIISVLFTACIKSKNAFYTPEPVNSDKSVMLSIDCSDILNNVNSLYEGLGKYVPEYGLVIPDAAYCFEEGDTVYDVLVNAARINKVQLETKGVFGGREVEGINYIYNSSCGSSSRWIYKVNGEVQQPVCSERKVSDGDIIQWVFVCGDD